MFRVTLQVEGVAREYLTPLVFVGVGERELKLPDARRARPGRKDRTSRDGHSAAVGRASAWRSRSPPRREAWTRSRERRRWTRFSSTPCEIEPRMHMAAVDGELVQRVAAARVPTCARPPSRRRARRDAGEIVGQLPRGNAHGRSFRAVTDRRPSDSRCSRNRSDARRSPRRDRRRAARAVPPSELLTYTADALPSYHKQPGLAVFPGTRDEVIAVVRELAARGSSVRPARRGHGTVGRRAGRRRRAHRPQSACRAFSRSTRRIVSRSSSRAS